MLKNSAVREGFLVFIIFVVIYFTTMSGYVYPIDGTIMYQNALSIIKDGVFSVPATILNEEKGIMQPIHNRYAVGFSLAMIPLILAGYFLANFISSVPTKLLVEFFASSTNSIITALVCLGIYLFAKGLGFSKRISFVLTLFYGLGTIAWQYSKSSFSEPLQSLGLLFTLYYIFEYRKKAYKPFIILSGIFFGIFSLAKVFNILLLPVIIFYLAYDKNIQIAQLFKKLFLFFSGLTPFIILLLVINKTRYHAFFVTGYEDIVNEVMDISPRIFIRLFQILFSFDVGFFIYNPILLISLFGMRNLFHQHKIEGITFLLILLLYIIGLSSLTSYGAAWSWGSRLSLPIMNIFILPAGYALSLPKVKKPIQLCCICGAAVIIAISFLIQLPSILAQPQQYFSLRYSGFKKAGVEDKFIPGNLVGQFLLLKHKITEKNEVYRLAEFGINSNKIIDQSRSETFKGLDLWFLHASDILKIPALRYLYLITFIIILYFLYRLKLIWRYESFISS